MTAGERGGDARAPETTSADHAGGPWLLAVDGVDGSGKSVFADQLAAALRDAGIETVLLRVDDYRRSVDWQRPDRAEADAYHDDYYALDELDAGVRALLAGAEALAIPLFDSVAGQRSGGVKTVHLPGAGPRAVVVEGVFALRVDAVRQGGGHIYLHTSFPEAHRRVVARDTARGRTAADVRHRIERRYFPAQERYLRDWDPAGRAAVLVDHERLGDPRVVRFDGARLGPPIVEAAVRQTLASFAAPSVVK